MKLFYETMYRHFTAPWELGPRKELVELVESGAITPCRAIDLGCGTGANSVFLAQHGFEVTGVDFAAAGIEKARRAASDAGVSVEFVVDDLRDLKQVSGSFELLVDYGVLDDLRPDHRARYRESILPLTHPGTRFLLWGFEYPVRWWERLVPFFDRPFAEGEIMALFGDRFRIDTIARTLDWKKWPPGTVAYLLTRNDVVEPQDGGLAHRVRTRGRGHGSGVRPQVAARRGLIPGSGSGWLLSVSGAWCPRVTRSTL